MNPEELYAILEAGQRAKGFHFNKDHEMTLELLGALLFNRDRYGYMSCPCRLAVGDQGWDRDIFCPCVYREPDVREYGSCYCGLYVSEDWNEARRPRVYVPERRPPEKSRYKREPG